MANGPWSSLADFRGHGPGSFFSFPAKTPAVIRCPVSSNPVYAFFATPKSLGPFVLRMLLAAVFVYHGGQKAFGWFGGDGWSETLLKWSGENGMGFSVGITVAVMLLEVLVAISMFFGFLTRLAAVGVMAVMIGALHYVHAAQGIASCEFPFSILMVAVALFFLGGGRLSVDRAISGQLLPSLGGY
jgi:putative oxidoreductase